MKPQSKQLIAATFLIACFANMPVFAQAVIVTDLVQPTNTKNENAAARIVGGVAGALLGGAITKGADSLTKAVTVLGLGFLGQSAGDILTRNLTDQNGNPVVKVGTDSRGQPVYESVLTTSFAMGMKMPKRVSREVYTDAVSRASAEIPIPPVLPNGGTFRALEKEQHTGIYALMVASAVARSEAIRINKDLDVAELAKAVAPYDLKTVATFKAANDAYAKAFQIYVKAFQQVSVAIATAEKNQFEVASQRLLMAVVPGDLRFEPGTTIHWPGVDERLHALQTVDPLAAAE